ncbi:MULTISPECIES: hypothetical protein [Aeromonas]|uniref:hypothetical protein n=1 Tax=Aeromonas TaxID=642 RepID=UPI000D68CEFF|nr:MULTISPECIES: hypothetical protein [Aeromonas]MDH1449749.1 hypothetical protein [Aeromonas caviae]MDH1455075.1 hypothetical protein [Aeromonas caviae]MDH1499266.1 hypothetical protein [Aeromonas caviae]MDH1635703.1 hypothetical protein [Aeromonas caviae]GKR18322.1 hypothetical protein KAM467_13660 [Aeromonas caviae]
MSPVICFENEFGSLRVSLVTDYLSVSNISRDIPEVCANLFDVETAEKIALVTDNKSVQLCMCYPLNGLGYMVYHRNGKEAAVCKIENIEFSCNVSPAEQIQRMARSLPM